MGFLIKLIVKEKEKNEKLQNELKKIDQKGALIIPLLLILNKRDHMFGIENKFYRQLEKLSKEEKKDTLNKKFRKYQNIQNYFIENSSNLCTIIPCNINNYEETLVIYLFFSYIYIKKNTGCYS